MSAEVERIYSQAGLLITDTRSGMTDNTIEACQVQHHGLKNHHFLGKIVAPNWPIVNRSINAITLSVHQFTGSRSRCSQFINRWKGSIDWWTNALLGSGPPRRRARHLKWNCYTPFLFSILRYCVLSARQRYYFAFDPQYSKDVECSLAIVWAAARNATELD